MKTQNLTALSLLLVLSGCSSSTSKNETHSDSTTVQPISTTPTSSPLSSPVTVTNFPDYSSELLSEDPLEAEVTSGIDELISANNNLNFLTIQSHYLRGSEFEGDYGKVTETEEVTEIWFFDSSGNLKAFSRKYYRDGEGRDTKTVICFYSKDALIAVSEQWDQDNQIGMMYHKKFLVSKCPKCGVNVNKEAGGSGQVTKYLENDDLKEFENQYYTNFDELTGGPEGEWKNAEESNGDFVIKENIEQWPDSERGGKPYVVERSMSKDLYGYFQFNNFISLFNIRDGEIPEKTAQLFLNSDGTGSFSAKDILESEPFYFMLYKKFKPVGPGVEEMYAASFTKNAQPISNFLVGSSFPSSGPDGGGEEYESDYDSDKHILTVTNTIIEWDEGTQKEKSKETITQYTLDRDGSIIPIKN